MTRRTGVAFIAQYRRIIRSALWNLLKLSCWAKICFTQLSSNIYYSKREKKLRTGWRIHSYRILRTVFSMLEMSQTWPGSQKVWGLIPIRDTIRLCSVLCTPPVCVGFLWVLRFLLTVHKLASETQMCPLATRVHKPAHPSACLKPG